MERLLLRPLEAAEMIGVGRSKVYELLASGDLPSIRIGGSVRVPLDALRAWIDRQIDESANDGPDR
jgi:excisionase family DNA binding protein